MTVPDPLPVPHTPSPRSDDRLRPERADHKLTWHPPPPTDKPIRLLQPPPSPPSTRSQPRSPSPPAPGESPGPLTGRRSAVSSAASRLEQPSGHPGPGPRPAAVAAAAAPPRLTPAPSPSAGAGGRGSLGLEAPLPPPPPPRAAARGAGREAPRRGPGRAELRDVRAVLLGARGGGVQPGLSENKGGWQGESGRGGGRSALDNGLPPPAT